MKREGRQHGFVTCYEAPPPELSRRRIFNKLVVDSAVAGDQFIKVSNKPTNLSKFTGRCLHPYKGCKCCHINPGYKSKHKTKGTMKLRSMDSGEKFAKYYSGTSVTGVLAYLAHENGYNDDDDMSFCDVGLSWGHEDGDECGDDDDGWYLVGGEMQ